MDVGDHSFQLPGQQSLRGIVGHYFAVEIAPLVYLVKLFAVGMKAIHATFVMDPQQDQQAAGHAKGEAQDIYSRKCFVTDQIAPGDEEIVLDHRKYFYGLRLYYSFLRLFTGFVPAARIVCQHTVNSVTANNAAPATAKVHHGMSVR